MKQNPRCHSFDNGGDLFLLPCVFSAVYRRLDSGVIRYVQSRAAPPQTVVWLHVIRCESNLFKPVCTYSERRKIDFDGKQVFHGE